jgi:DNA-binding Lrp family transcriptional regulator
MIFRPASSRPLPPSSRDALTRLDLKLVKALEDDPRRPLSEVARTVGVSVKTARRRIGRMESEGLIHFTTHWWLEAQPDPVCNIHLTIQEGAERDKVAFLLIKKLAAGTISNYAFSNLPNLIVVTVWFRNGREMWEACRELETEGPFVSVVPNIMRAVYYYDDHRRSFLAEMLEESSAPGRG